MAITLADLGAPESVPQTGSRISLADVLAYIDARKKALGTGIKDLFTNPQDAGPQMLSNMGRIATESSQESLDAVEMMRSKDPEVRKVGTEKLLNSLIGGGLLGKIDKVGARAVPPDQLSAEGLNKATRAKRVVGTTGQYVGAPPGIDSSQKYSALIDRYVDRIDEALNNGVERGYFYERGTAANRAVTDSPYEANRLAMLQGITSSEAPVQTNTGWGIKAVEQNAMGAPIHTGKYPNAMREKVERVLTGDFSHIGEKTHRYASGLAGDVKGLAPNDRWEIRSFGYGGDTAGPAQHAFMDEARQKAMERWNARHPDQPPISILEAQELNWATQRARDMKISHQEAAADTIQDALKAHTIQHSWESRGGEKAGHLQDMPPEALGAYHDTVTGTLLDQGGKDKLIRAMGGELQLPAVHGPGVYEGVVAPGTQSRSLGYMTKESGLDPTTAARVNATEAARAYMLGQDAYAYHGMLSPKTKKGTDTFDINFGRTISSPEALQAQQLLDRALGGGEAGIVPTESGFRALRFSDNPKFAQTFEKEIEPSLADIAGGKMTITPGSRSGGFAELGWGQGNATRDFLAALENQNAPRLPGYADSPDMRALAGQIQALYLQQKAQGLTPNPKLTMALGEYARGGLPALRELMAKGLAPGIGGLGLLGLYGQEQQGSQ